jgi:hypothetical protein
MHAFNVTIPAKWHFQGVLYQGGNCTSVPFNVFRATSPDGLSYVERMPVLAWFWGKGPFLKFMPKTDCLPLNGPMSAQKFLEYLAGVMKVQYVGPAPVPAEENEKAQKGLHDVDAIFAPKYAASHMTPPKNTRELARAIVQYQNGSSTPASRRSPPTEALAILHSKPPVRPPPWINAPPASPTALRLKISSPLFSANGMHPAWAAESRIPGNRHGCSAASSRPSNS